MQIPAEIGTWRKAMENATLQQTIDWAQRLFPGEVTLATALGIEDQVLTHAVVAAGKRIPIFMLDTGRHFEETYRTLDLTQRLFQVRIKTYFPQAEEVERVTDTKGPFYFRRSVEERKNCCFIRKVKPLRRALKGYRAWITGLRQEQSPTRTGVEVVEWDAGNGLVKINPLWNWDLASVWRYIRRYAVPYNTLHDRGFPSIGCAPCTRAVVPGEDLRAGRWWWEQPEAKECGLHTAAGKLTRRQSQPLSAPTISG